MMKSLAILAATLVAAQASQDAGPGLGRLLKGNQNGIVNKQEEEDCTEEDCGRRLKDENNYMLNDNDDEMDSKWCQENPEDCDGRRLDGVDDQFIQDVADMMGILDRDGDGEITQKEIESLFLVNGMSQAQAEQRWDDLYAFDSSYNGTIDFEELSNVLRISEGNRQERRRKARLQAMYEHFKQQRNNNRRLDDYEGQANKNDDEMDSKWCRENPDDCGRRLRAIDGLINGEERDDCTEENPDDCRRRLQSQSQYEKDSAIVDEWLGVMDTDGDGVVSLEEFRDLFIGFAGMDPRSVESLFFSIDLDYPRYEIDGRELFEFQDVRRSVGMMQPIIKKKMKKQSKDEESDDE